MPRIEDFLARFTRHIHYSQKALWWAHEATDLANAGKVQAAKRAADKAEAWLDKAKALEPTSDLRFKPTQRVRSKV